MFRLDTSIDGLPEAVFRFGQALTRIHHLTSTFYGPGGRGGGAGEEGERR